MEDLIDTVNSQDEKMQSLTKRLLYLESTIRETQSQNLITTNTSDLLKLELEKLKQYSRRSCLVIPGVELPRNKTSEKAEETETKVWELFSCELGVNEYDFDYELDKAHRLPINSTESTRRNSPRNIICKFRTHHFIEQLQGTADNHNVSFDTFQLFSTVLKRKLGSDENAYEGDNENKNAETIEVDQ